MGAGVTANSINLYLGRFREDIKNLYIDEAGIVLVELSTNGQVLYGKTDKGIHLVIAYADEEMVWWLDQFNLKEPDWGTWDRDELEDGERDMEFHVDQP